MSGHYERQCRAQGVEVPDEAAGGALCLPVDTLREDDTNQVLSSKRGRTGVSSSASGSRSISCGPDCGCATGLRHWWDRGRTHRSLPPTRPSCGTTSGSSDHGHGDTCADADALRSQTTGPARTVELETWYQALITKHTELCEEHGKLKAEAEGLREARYKLEVGSPVAREATPRFGSQQITGPESAAGGRDRSDSADRRSPPRTIDASSSNTPAKTLPLSPKDKAGLRRWLLHDDSEAVGHPEQGTAATAVGNSQVSEDDLWADGIVADEISGRSTAMQVSSSEGFTPGRTASGREPIGSAGLTGSKLMPTMEVTQEDIERLAQQVRELSEQFERDRFEGNTDFDENFDMTEGSMMDDVPSINVEVHMGLPLSKKPGSRLEEQSTKFVENGFPSRSVIDASREAEEEVGEAGKEGNSGTPGRSNTVPNHMPAVVTSPGARRHNRLRAFPRSMPSPMRSVDNDVFCNSRCGKLPRCLETQK